MKTYMAKPAEVQRKWHIIDAENMPLGRLATAVADLLSGKLKPTFTPHVDCGDFVVVINTDKMVLTGKKLTDKFYRHHSGFPGGLKEMNYKTLMQTNSPKALQVAVKGMLRKNALGRKQITRLFAYKDANHNQQAQQPVAYAVKGVRE
ncbi:MAG: 50S ribosomal protein L13 [Clostridia bacterium]|nr:50S ribosomal protein L13 [Clostridia bacterium]MBR2220543.1 50S ribosomal protein L13 [Clostridia bacterium]MBR2433143.1 50S ribosomal protein L13 [Clostridia bacterium]MBR3790821.1 50S ribosomal protein L13 [Clostridia bacterium]